jgi:hypothetical protein
MHIVPVPFKLLKDKNEQRSIYARTTNHFFFFYFWVVSLCRCCCVVPWRCVVVVFRCADHTFWLCRLLFGRFSFFPSSFFGSLLAAFLLLLLPLLANFYILYVARSARSPWYRTRAAATFLLFPLVAIILTTIITPYS